MFNQSWTACPHCNILNQHNCNFCNGTGWVPNSGGGSVIGMAIFLITFALFTLVSALSSLLISGILILYIQKTEPGAAALPFGKAFKLLFKTTLLYQAILTLISITLFFLQKQKVEMLFDSFQEPDLIHLFKAVFIPFLVIQLITVMLTAVMLRSELSGYLRFQKFSGYLRATIFTAIVIMPFLLITSYCVTSVISTYVFKQPLPFFPSQMQIP